MTARKNVKLYTKLNFFKQKHQKLIQKNKQDHFLTC